MNLHQSQGRRPEVQAVLPNIRVDVTDTGVLDVSVDGAGLPPPAHGEWTRERFGELLDAVTRDRTIAVRVEVHEVDGAVFTDLVQPAKPVRTTPIVLPAEPARAPQTVADSSSVMEVAAVGFLSGEEVAVAVVVSRTDAKDGTVHALVDPAKFIPCGSRREVILFGRISGTIHVETLP